MHVSSVRLHPPYQSLSRQKPIAPGLAKQQCLQSPAQPINTTQNDSHDKLECPKRCSHELWRSPTFNRCGKSTVMMPKYASVNATSPKAGIRSGSGAPAAGLAATAAPSFSVVGSVDAGLSSVAAAAAAHLRRCDCPGCLAIRCPQLQDEHLATTGSRILDQAASSSTCTSGLCVASWPSKRHMASRPWRASQADKTLVAYMYCLCDACCSIDVDRHRESRRDGSPPLVI